VQPVKVALHAADPLSMVGLVGHLESSGDVQVLRGAQRQLADVVIVAADRLSADVIADAKRAIPGAGFAVVLVVSVLDNVEQKVAGDLGVAAVLPRDGITAQLLVGSVVAAGKRDLPVLRSVVRQPRPVAPSASGRLTLREEQVLRLMADGLDTAEIAEQLAYSERTVKNVFYGLTSRLKLRNRPHAVAYALRLGLI
jgi:DNA-binding NarL/FixJ family response regulator